MAPAAAPPYARPGKSWLTDSPNDAQESPATRPTASKATAPSGPVRRCARRGPTCTQTLTATRDTRTTTSAAPVVTGPVRAASGPSVQQCLECDHGGTEGAGAQCRQQAVRRAERGLLSHPPPGCEEERRRTDERRHHRAVHVGAQKAAAEQNARGRNEALTSSQPVPR